MEKILAIQNHEGLCWKCLQSFNKSNIHIINIPEMGYGSGFDGWSIEIHLCEDCYQNSIKDIHDLWSMDEIKCDFNNDFTEYKHEDQMFEYIDNMPIQGQQFVLNEFIMGWNSYTMTPQDWIDYQLDILPHDKCKEYSLYSLDEIRAYKERFPTCEYPVNKIYSDGSKSCWCPFDANGEYGQKTGVNISEECYECKRYTPRVTPLKDIKDKHFNDYMDCLRYKAICKELGNKFENL